MEIDNTNWSSNNLSPTIVIPQDGWYIVTFGINWTSDSSPARIVYARLEGSFNGNLSLLSQDTNDTQDRPRQVGAFQWLFRANDTVQIIVISVYLPSSVSGEGSIIPCFLQLARVFPFPQAVQYKGSFLITNDVVCF